MPRFSVTVDTDGPRTLGELGDAIKAYSAITGREPSAIVLPLATYRLWADWPPEDKLAALINKSVLGDKKPATELSMEAVPDAVCGLMLSVAHQFRMF